MSKSSNYSIEINKVPIRWEPGEGRMSFFDIPSVTFWLAPSLLRILQPLREEVGEELYRLMVAYQASLGTEEDYHQMVTQLGSTFEEGFLAWGAAVSAAGWGHFELLEFDRARCKAVVRISNPWELQMFESQSGGDAWGCPFLMGKITGIFSHALGSTCWADERNISVMQDASSVELHIYPAKLTIEQELEKLRSLRRTAREQKLEEEIRKRKLVEERLQIFHDLIDSGNDATFIIDPESGHFLEVNSIAAKDLGYSREALVGMSVADIGVLPPNLSWEQHVLDIRQVAGRLFEAQHVRKDGYIFPVEISISYITVGETNFLLATARNITERKQVENQLKASERRYRELFDNAHDVIFIVDPANGEIIRVNNRVTAMLGYTPDELTGRSVRDLHPDEMPELMAFFADVTEQGQGHSEELTCLGKSGEKYSADMSAFLIEEGNKKLVVAAIRDITERKKSEETVRKFSSIIEQTGEGVVVTGRDGTIEYINSAFTRLTGYSPEEVIGQNPRILKSGNQDSAFYKNMWDTILSGEVWQGKVIDRKKDGTFYPVMLTISPICNDAEEITHFAASHADLTEHDELQAKFEQAQKMEAVGTLVGGIAHNFNNMLAGISGNMYLLRLKMKGMPELLDKVQRVEGLTLQAADMVSELLTFASKGIVEKKDVDLAVFLKEACKLVTVALPENIKTIQEFTSESLPIHGDANQIQQVLLNLLNNAVDAVADVKLPEIKVCLEPFEADSTFIGKHQDIDEDAFRNDQRFARLRISDNGCGIPKEQLQDIFEPFFTTKEVGTGTGLGLAMSYGAVRSHHGVLEVESEVGKGTTFSVYLPLVQSQAIPIKAPSGEAVASASGETILLADDEQHVREVTVEVLEAMGYKVLQAADGLEAIEVFKAHQEEIAIALLDVVMPRLGGVRLAESLREMKPNVPVVFMTGYDKEHVLAGEEEIPNSEILTKPVQFEALGHNIQQLLG